MEVTEENLVEAMACARNAQAKLKSLLIKERLKRIARVRQSVVDQVDAICDAAKMPQRRSRTETISSEVLPFCDALRFLERSAASVLKTRRVGITGRPLWLWGTGGKVERQPWGSVLILAPWNYPLLLAGVQAAQALVAGNSVFLKPAPGCESVTAELVRCFHAAFDEHVIQQVDSRPRVAQDLIEHEVDKVVLTGSAQTGRRVAAAAAEKLTPATMELSGCDAMIVLEDADLERAARCVAFAMRLNSSATCIAPRRVFVDSSVLAEFKVILADKIQAIPELAIHATSRDSLSQIVDDALSRGADVLGETLWEGYSPLEAVRPIVLCNVPQDAQIFNADIFAPVCALQEFENTEAVIRMVSKCEYALAASVFGSQKLAGEVADAICVGTVTVNDIVVPTADPRIPFGGRKHSGYGVTRGAEGLLEMTCPKVVMLRRGKALPHLDDPKPGDEAILRGLLEASHSRAWHQKWQGVRRLMRGVSAK